MGAYDSAEFSKGNWGNLTAAEMRDFGENCETALAGCGLTFVSRDVEWTTDPAVPGTSHTAAVNSIYRFNDTLSPDLYLKFGFGVSTLTSGSDVQYKLIVSVSHDGGSTYPNSIYINEGRTGAETGLQWSAYFGESGFVLYFDNKSTTYNQTLVVVERARDHTDAVDPNSYYFIAAGLAYNTSTSLSTSISYGMNKQVVVSPYSNNNAAIVEPYEAASMTPDNNIATIMPLQWVGPGNHTYSRLLAGGASTVFPRMSQATVTAPEGNRIYRTVRSHNPQLVDGISSAYMLYRFG